MPWAAIGGSLLGGLLASDASKSASKSQERAAAADREQARELHDLDVARNQPFYEGGTNALSSLLGRLGLSEGSTATMGQPLTAEQVMAEPGYQFGLDQGMNALTQRLNATGQRASGPAFKALTRYGTDYATSKYGDAWTRRMEGDRQAYNMLTGLIGTGQASANRQGAAGQQLAATNSNSIWGGANANAANAVSQGNIWGNVINQGLSAYGRSANPWGSTSTTGVSPAPYDPYENPFGG